MGFKITAKGIVYCRSLGKKNRIIVSAGHDFKRIL